MKWKRHIAAALAFVGAVSFTACSKGSVDSLSGDSTSSTGSRSTAGGTGATPAPNTPSSPTPGPATTPGPTPAPAPAPKTYAHEWAVSVDGSDTAAGTASAPFRTISRAVQAAGPGDRITVHAGTYAEFIRIGGVKAGTQAAPILLQGEGKPKLVGDSSTSVILSVEEPYWQVDGFEVDAQGANKIGVGFQGSTHGSILSHSEVHNGSGGAAVSAYVNAEGVTIDSNDIHDWVRSGDDAHGVLVQWTAKNITITNNTIHDNSGDSIQCIGPETYADGATPADGVLIQNNDLYGSREQAIDLKTCTNVTIRSNKLHHAVWDPVNGGDATVVVHMSAANILLEKNDFYDAGDAIGVGGNHIGPPPNNIVFRENKVHDMTTGGGHMNGGGVLAMGSTNVQVYNNTFTRLEGAALHIGWGEGSTENMSVKNNVFDTSAVEVNTTLSPGLVMDYNLYSPNASFVSTTQGTYALTGWQGLGFDAHSEQGTLGLDATTLVAGALAVDHGTNVGLPFCGAGPDIGAVETGC